LQICRNFYYYCLMEYALTQFRQALKKHALSSTEPREKIFSALYTYGLQTMSQLIERVSTTCDRSTTYRTVDTLTKAGIIRKVPTGFKYRLELSDDFLPHHHHLTCNKCLKSIEISSDLIESSIASIAEQYNFTLSSHILELRGLCPTCCS